MAAPEKKDQRNPIGLVDKPVQLTLIWRVIMHWTIFVSVGLIVAMTHALLADRTLGTNSFRSVVSEQKPFFFIALLMLPIFLLDTFKLSRRVVGPLLRIRRSMRELANGSIAEPISLRAGDVWTDLANDLNRLIARLQLAKEWENKTRRSRQLSAASMIHESSFAPQDADLMETSGVTSPLPRKAAADGERPTRDQRKSIFVDDPVQGAMMRRILGHWLGYLFVSCLLELALTWMLDPLGGTSLALKKFIQANGPMIVAAAGLIMVFAWDMVTVTHRIAGPMVQLRRQLKALSLGQPTARVAFRPDDFCHELATEFNEMRDQVEPRLTTLQAYLQYADASPDTSFTTDVGASDGCQSVAV